MHSIFMISSFFTFQFFELPAQPDYNGSEQGLAPTTPMNLEDSPHLPHCVPPLFAEPYLSCRAEPRFRNGFVGIFHTLSFANTPT